MRFGWGWGLGGPLTFLFVGQGAWLRRQEPGTFFCIQRGKKFKGDFYRHFKVIYSVQSAEAG